MSGNSVVASRRQKVWEHPGLFLFKLEKLLSLDFSNNDIGLMSHSEIQSFFEVLKGSPKLKSLNLSNNKLGQIISEDEKERIEGIKHWTKYVGTLSKGSIETLNLCGNKLKLIHTVYLKLFDFYEISGNSSATSATDVSIWKRN